MATNLNPRKRPAPGSSDNDFMGVNNANLAPNMMYQPLPTYSLPQQIQSQLNTNQIPNNQLVLSQQAQFNTGSSSNNISNGSMVAMNGNTRSGTAESDALKESARKIAKAKSGKKTIPPFVQKLAKFVNDTRCDDVIRWSDDGNSFLVLDEDAFSKNLIPDLFKHNNYASFVRQLNMYGFHKVVGLSDGSMKTAEQRAKPILEYANEYFKKGQPDLLWLIQKPKNAGKKKPSGKKTKNGRQESDEDAVSSDDGGTVDGGTNEYQPLPKMIEDGSRAHHQDNVRANMTASPKPDIADVIKQLDAIRNHQALISSAISRLRTDHNALYQQAVAFQQLHDRHESSINSILGFLATVYDKSIGGQLNGAYSNMFTVANGQPANSTTVVTSPSPSPGARMPGRRLPLLIEGAPAPPAFEVLDDEVNPFEQQPQNSNVNNNNNNNRPLNFNYNSRPGNTQKPLSNSYQSPSIQEIFSPNNGLSDETSPELQPAKLQNQPTMQPQTLAQIQRSPVPAFNRLSPALLSPGIPQNALTNHQSQLDQTDLTLQQLENYQKSQDANINNLHDVLKNILDDKNGDPLNNPTLTVNNPTPPGNYLDDSFTDFGHSNDFNNGNCQDLDAYLQTDFLDGSNGMNYSANDPNFLGYNYNNDNLSSLDFPNFANDGRIVSTDASSEADSPHSVNFGMGGGTSPDDGGSDRKKRKVA